MQAVLQLPAGVVFLPGVDLRMDDAAWACLSDAHPQAILKRTLDALRYDRHELNLWPTGHADKMAARDAWLSRALSPQPAPVEDAPVQDIAIVDAATAQEEVETIAHFCAMELQQTPALNIVVVSNDPFMAQRLAAILSLYGVGTDASGGFPLSGTPFGMALSALLRLMTQGAGLDQLWSALKNPSFAPGWPFEARTGRMAEIEKILRDPLRCPDAIEDILPQLEEPFKTKLTALRKQAAFPRTLPEWAELALQAIPDFIATGTLEDYLAAEAASRLLDDLAAAPLQGKLPAREAVGILCDCLMNLPCRPDVPAPKIHVLGTLEARLVEADLAILSGLNEGTWPDMPQPSPFLSRAMRHAIGLPDSERHAALSGHDFQQAFLTPRIVLTRAQRDKDGPALPARWWLRLKSITPPAAWTEMERKGRALSEARREFHEPQRIMPAAPPAPLAAGAALPFPLSVTAVETWRADPYSFWARHAANCASWTRFSPLSRRQRAAACGTKSSRRSSKASIEMHHWTSNGACSKARWTACSRATLCPPTASACGRRGWRACATG